MRWLRARSVRARVTVGAALVVAVTLAALGFGIVSLVREQAVAAVSATANAQARTVATLAEAGQLPALLEVDSLDDTLLQVVAANGTVLAASPQLTGLGPLTGTGPPEQRASERTLRIELPSSDGVFRVVTAPVATPGGRVVVHAASSLAQADEMLADLGRLMIGGLALALLVIVAVTWVVVTRALRPVEAIRAEVDAITASDLEHRVPVPHARDEVARLAVTMNRMLDRLADAALRQRRFVADVSHEIRSPIASLRTQLDVARAHPEITDWRELVGDLTADTGRLEELTTDLLLLARLDADASSGRPAGSQRVDLGGLVGDVLAHRRPDRVPVDAAPAGGVVVAGNRGQLERVLTNLLDNAVRHAASRVEVFVTIAGGEARLLVCDDGPGVALADRERIFDRFVRLDDARSRDDGGTGLGLPIAREIARAHGGDVRVVDVQAQVIETVPERRGWERACVEVMLPLAP